MTLCSVPMQTAARDNKFFFAGVNHGYIYLVGIVERRESFV